MSDTGASGRAPGPRPPGGPRHTPAALDRDEVLKVLTFSLGVGETMLESSVATSDVEDALRRLTAAYGLGRCEVSVTLNVISLCLLQPVDGPITLVKVVDIGEPRLDRIAQLAHLSREVEAGRLDIDQAVRSADEIRARPQGVHRAIRLLALVVSTWAWVVFADGGAVGAVAGALGALVIELAIVPLSRTRVPVVFAGMLAAAVAVAAPSAFAWAGLPIVLGPAIIGGLYPLLPGGALVASVTDGLSGAPLSSMAKGLQAVISATATAVGVLVTLTVVSRLGVVSDAVATPTPTWLVALASGTAIAGLAVARSMPLEFVLPAAGLAIAAWLTSRSVGDVGSGVSLGVFLAAVLIGLGAQILARLQATSATVYTSVAVFVLVPGVRFYSSMLAFSQGDSSVGVDLLIEALGVSASIAAGIALGVAVGRSVPAPRPAVRVWQRARPPRPVVRRAGHPRSTAPGTAGPRAPKR